MATVPAVAYLGDRYDYIPELNRWGAPPYYALRTFQDGTIGQSAQNDISGLSDGWDQDAGGSTYNDEVLFNGRQVCKCVVNAGSQGSLYFGGTVKPNSSTKRMQRCWQQIVVMFPSSFDFDETPDSLKFLRQLVSGGVGSVNLNINNSSHSTAFNLIMEAHTSEVGGNSPHNSNNRFLPKSDWEFPKDEWVNVQMMSQYDIRYPVEDRSDSKAKVIVWIGDEKVGEFSGTNGDFHSMISDSDSMDLTRFCTYVNTPGNAGVTKAMHAFVAEYEVSSIEPSYTDAEGNPKLPPRVTV